MLTPGLNGMRSVLGLTAVVAGVLGGATGCTPEASTAQAAAVYQRPIGDGGVHDLTPVRGERGALALHRDGDSFPCSSCHEGFTGDLGEDALKGEHADLTFNHGSNVRCLNCHHPKNADAYVYHDGSEIPGDEPTRLCAKCHGPHFREWEMGVHGRVNGYWDPALGTQQYLDCIECHDPHHPPFQPLRPVAPPVLTRFTRPTQGGDGHVR